MKSELSQLLQRNDVWRANQWQAELKSYPSGFARLDQELAGGGWPQTGVCQLICAEPGQGELQLLLPLIKRLSQDNQWLVWLSPPAIPYPPALAAAGVDLAQQLWLQPEDHKQALWALEQSVSSGACRMALAWLDHLSLSQARRLQLVAEKGNCLLFLFVAQAHECDSHPVQLKLELARQLQGTQVRIIKRRGGWPSAPFVLDLGDSELGIVAEKSSGEVIRGPW
ncbi:translesion DNA synthesis-associated protein ImuA [Paraferrimonas sedimenticola]|uniref:Recombinase RecA n=1 Tax=Paraferrimonas sedimenticola TaxID=375674 RepID=A0AA37VVK2_9GAMM|nr:translesion DNA synthesis-associated protein ImuA [Paraferrimonas sedimenticola]GLP96174.1 recombinase RecA [Paraferrimonas sedimenticola]